jgi:hypothetical protein
MVREAAGFFDALQYQNNTITREVSDVPVADSL